MYIPSNAFRWGARVVSTQFKQVPGYFDFTVVKLSNSRRSQYLIFEGYVEVEVGNLLEVTDLCDPGLSLSEVYTVLNKSTNTWLVQREDHSRPFVYLVRHDIDDCHKVRSSMRGCYDPGHLFVDMSVPAIQAFFERNPWRGYEFCQWGDVYYPQTISAGYEYWESAITPINKLWEKLCNTSNHDLVEIWFALYQRERGENEDMYDAKNGITMETWEQLVYSVMSSKGINVIEAGRMGNKLV